MTTPRSRPEREAEAAPEVRVYGPEDRDQVIALWRDCGLMVPLNDPAQDIALCRESGHGEIFVAAQDGAVVASVMVGHDGHRGWLYYLAVRPAARRRGLGRRMVTEAEAWLCRRAVPKVELMIRESNAEVATFWRRIGYAIEPRTVMSRRLDGKAPR